MISKEEIKKLADLARIEMGEEETESLRGEMDDILDYLSQIKEITNNTRIASLEQGEVESGAPSGVVNVMRDDENPTEPETYSKELIAEFPHKDGDYLKVKKIL